MVLKTRHTAVTLVAIVLSALVSSPVFAQDFIVAKVGNVPVTAFEQSRELQKLVPLAGSYHRGVSEEKVNELKEEALAELIERAYMVQYAIEEELSVSADEIDAVFSPVRARFASEDEFLKALGDESVSEFRASIYRRLLSEKALDHAVQQKVSVSEDAIRSYYEGNKERFMRPRQFRASHILVKVDPSSSAEEKAERRDFANNLAERAKAGDDFYDLAYYNSDDRTKFVGGDLGYFHQGQMIGEIEDAILTMKVGDVSAPIQTLYGYSIIKLVEDNASRQLSFEEMKPKLMEEERSRQYEAIKTEWLESLKSRYDVERIQPE